MILKSKTPGTELSQGFLPLVKRGLSHRLDNANNQGNNNMRSPQRLISFIERFPHHEREGIIWSFPGKSSEKIILLALNTYVDAEGFCHPGVETIGKMVGMSRSAVFRNLKILEGIGILYKEEIYLDGRQTSNDYVVNFRKIIEITAHISLEIDQPPLFNLTVPPSQNDIPPGQNDQRTLRSKKDLEDLDPDNLLQGKIACKTRTNPDPDVRVGEIEREEVPKPSTVELQIQSGVSRSVEILSEMPPEMPPIPSEALPQDKFGAAIAGGGNALSGDYFPLWYVLYRKALIAIGRSADPEKIARQAWRNRFPLGIPMRGIEGGLEPKKAAADPNLLEPIEAFCDRIRATCGEKAANFVLGDHWHQVRIIHASIETIREKKEFCSKVGFDLGDSVCGVKGMSKYLESLDAESSLEWVQIAQVKAQNAGTARANRRKKFFDN